MAVNLFIGTAWGTTTHWSLGSVPTASDGHVATLGSTSSNCTLGAARVCNNLDCSAYTATLTMSTYAITVSGNITLGSGMSQSGTGGIGQGTAGNLTSNGYVWPTTLTLSGLVTHTLTDNWTVTGLVTLAPGATGTMTVNGFKIYCQTSFSCTSATNRITTGTTVIEFSGGSDGTWIGTGRLQLPVIINKSGGTLTQSGAIYFDSKTITYTLGTVVMNATFYCYLASTFDCDRGSGVYLNFYNVYVLGTTTLTTDLYVSNIFGITGTGTFAGSGMVNGDWSISTLNLLPATTTVWTFTSNWTCVDLLLTTSTGQTTLSGAFGLSISGDITGAGTGLVLGAFTMTYVGNAGGGTWQSTNVIRNNFTINCPGNTLTIGTQINYNTGTLLYTAGTVDTTTNDSVLYITGVATTLNTNGISWNKVDIAGSNGVGGINISLSSNLATTSLFIRYYNVAFIGAGVWTCDNFYIVSTILASQFVSLVSTQTYTINTFIGAKISSAGEYNCVIKSSVADSQAILTFNGTSQSVIGLNVTDIDSSLGNKIWTLAGTLDNATNWAVSNSSIVPVTKSSSF